jgi:hypothetical protein
MSELTSRQWTLYNLLKTKKDWVKQAKIQEDLPNEYPLIYEDIEMPFHDTYARQSITKDIRAIKNSDVIQKIILSNARGVKIATADEFDEYFERKSVSLKRQFKLLYKQLKKAQMNNQTRIVFNSERDFIEAFKEAENE